MATFYVKTTGAATNSGSTDTDAASLSGAAATVSGSVVTLDGSPDLSALIIAAGLTQSTIYLNDASNSNQKIFKITAFDDTANTVTVSVAPTGVVSSSWAIGGRLVWTPANIEATLAAGDVVEFGDSPATRTATYITCRTSGDSTSGMITFKGKSGVMPTLNCTNTAVVITGGAQTNWLIKDLIVDQDGASGAAISNSSGHGWVLDNVRIIDAGGDGYSTGGISTLVRCEITGCGGMGINCSTTALTVVGCHIHDNTGAGITNSNAAPLLTLLDSVIDSNGGKGVHISGTTTAQTHINIVAGNTFYGNGDSGLEVTDADTVVILYNNIFSENGNAAGESNVEWVAGTAQLHGWHSYNTFFHSGGGSATNLTNLTATSSESTSDPLFTSAAGGDFSISSSSPAKATGFPGLLVSGNTGYRDMGAVQRQESASGGGTGIVYG
jgi:hypothetical protein